MKALYLSLAACLLMACADAQGAGSPTASMASRATPAFLRDKYALIAVTVFSCIGILISLAIFLQQRSQKLARRYLEASDLTILQQLHEILGFKMELTQVFT